MVFNVNKTTRLFLGSSRSNAFQLSATRKPRPELRAGQDNQSGRANSSMFGLLVSNKVGSHWF